MDTLTAAPAAPKRLIWRLKKGLDRRFRSGHPWVYSNELQASPKGVPCGAVVEMHDAGGAFLAFGYAHPQSLISFRTLSREAADTELLSPKWFSKKFGEALALPRILAERRALFAFVSEDDGIPGLIVDRYLLSEPSSDIVWRAGPRQESAEALRRLSKLCAPWNPKHASSYAT